MKNLITKYHLTNTKPVKVGKKKLIKRKKSGPVGSHMVVLYKGAKVAGYGSVEELTDLMKKNSKKWKRQGWKAWELTCRR